jgi:hypothetical protein
MATIDIDFEWWRDPAGYRTEPAEITEHIAYHAPKRPPDLPALLGQWGLAYTPLGIRVLTGGRAKPLYVRRRGGNLESYRPLGAFGSLFEIFAGLRTEDDVACFVERFGPLTTDGLDAEEGELIDGVLAHADTMRDLFLFSTGDRTHRAKLLSDLQDLPFAELKVTIGLDAGSKNPKLRLCPASLLDALWLQAAQHLSSGASLRQCRHCSQWFEVGPGTARRVDAKFCSDQHRISFNSFKRTTGEETHA